MRAIKFNSLTTSVLARKKNLLALSNHILKIGILWLRPSTPWQCSWHGPSTLKNNVPLRISSLVWGYSLEFILKHHSNSSFSGTGTKSVIWEMCLCLVREQVEEETERPVLPSSVRLRNSSDVGEPEIKSEVVGSKSGTTGKRPRVKQESPTSGVSSILLLRVASGTCPR